MIYKTLKKVSDVCQLLDKRTFPATTTINGVTFTNNGEGRWTISGKSTSNYSYYNLINNFPLKQGHTYLAPYAVIGTCYVEVKFMNKDYAVQWGKVIYTADENSKVTVGLIALDAFNGADTVLIPQLFDLTEMYGAGNEPTTVEEFRSKFPNDLYDYSPHCFITSYKNYLTCNTKNLFDINSANVTIKDDGSFVSKADHTSHFYSLNVTPGQIYTVSYYTTSRGSIGSGLNLSIQTGDYYRDGVQLFIRINPAEQDAYVKGTFRIPDGATKITFSCLMGSSSYKNFMIELGDTATDYVPYGHLTSYKKSLICKTKNLWTCDKTMSHVIYNSGTQVFKVTNTGSSSCYTLPTPIPAGTTLTITVYCLSGFTKDDVTIGGYHNETGNTSWQCFYRLPSNIDLSGKSFSSTLTTTNTLTDFWIFVYNLIPDNLQFKVQLELGDTATEYHPYGYL